MTKKNKLTLKECLESCDENLPQEKSRNKIRYEKLLKLRDIFMKKEKRIKRLNQNIRNKNRRIKKLSVIMKEAKDKNLIEQEMGDNLADIVGPNWHIFQRQLLKSKGKKLPKDYGPAIRSFALNLNFFSPKAYQFIREQLNNCLPHSRTLQKFYENVHCKPGFTKQSFLAIKRCCDEAKKTDEVIYVNIAFDEIHIRRHIDWNGHESYGFVDVGDGRGSGQMATQILVFMAVCLNRPWKIPIAFFPIVSLSAEQKHNLLILSAKHILQTGAQIVGAVFDGTSTNLTVSKLLGCGIRNIITKTTFKIENDNSEHIVHPDPCHMLKLVRNALADLRIFLNGSNQEISWIYLEKLIKLQEKEELHLGNKLRKAHVYFSRQKMKVKLAVQTFSKSVADELDFCREVLQMPEFAGSKPLSEFIRFINDSFDILNSRKVSAYEYKKRALCENNFPVVNNFAKEAIKYISNLRLACGTLLIHSKRRVGFVGLIADLKNIEILYNRFIVSEKLKFIPLYNLNQDRLMLFFSSIRMNLGKNNNPTVKQFISVYKKLLVRCTIREGGIGNCVPQEFIEILHVPELQHENVDPLKEINGTVERHQLIEHGGEDMLDDLILNQQFLNEHSYVAYPAKLSEYKKQVVHYISGFVVFKINKTLACLECLSALQGDYEAASLIAYKNKGGLQVPSKSVERICEKTESILRSEMHFINRADTVLQKHYFLKISIQVQKYFLNETLFEDQLLHMANNMNHYSALLKLIVEKYLHTRYYFLAKRISEKCSIRQQYNKLILFSGM